MKLSLTIWQRMTLTSVANNFVPARSIGQLRHAIALAEVLEMSVEEKQAVGIFQIERGQEAWADDGGKVRYEIEIGEAQVELLKSGLIAFQQQQGWRAVKGKEVLDMYEQLGIEGEVE